MHVIIACLPRCSALLVQVALCLHSRRACLLQQATLIQNSMRMLISV